MPSLLQLLPPSLLLTLVGAQAPAFYRTGCRDGAPQHTRAHGHASLASRALSQLSSAHLLSLSRPTLADPTYTDGGWTCAAWVGWTPGCFRGYPPITTPDRVDQTRRSVA